MSGVSPARILWESHPETGSVLHGYVKTKRGTKIRLFAISTTNVPGKRFVLRSDLPGYTVRDGRPVASGEQAKALARLILNQFAEMITE